MNIEQRYISRNYSKGVTITPRYIVVHETANSSQGANADAHYRYWNTNDNAQSSVHFVVDDKKILQLLPLTAKAWHVGDNKNHSDITNNNSIGIEICINSDGDYPTARQNSIDLVKQLLKTTGLSADRVVTHNDASGKWCPAIMLSKNLWEDFKAQIRKDDHPQEVTSVNDLVLELHNRGIISDKKLWLKKLVDDENSYWLARKTVKYLHGKGL